MKDGTGATRLELDSTGAIFLQDANLEEKKSSGDTSFQVVASTGDVSVLGTMLGTGNLLVNGDKCMVSASNGNVLEAGSLEVGKSALVTGNLSVDGGKFVATWLHPIACR